MAQPALGLQIRQLEQELGVDLLTRHSRGVVPTEAGRLLLERARTIIREIENTAREVRALGNVSGETLTLGVTPSIMLQIGPDILIDAREEMPQVFLSLVEELSFLLLEALERGELDLAFAYDTPERPGLERTPVLEEDLLFITPGPGGLMGEPIGLAEVLQRDLVLAGEKDIVRRIVRAEADKAGLALKVPYEVQSVPAMRAMVKRGAAASIMPYGTAVEELKAGTLSARRIVDPPLRRHLHLVRPANRTPFRQEAEIARFLTRIERRLADSLGGLARPFGSG